VFETVFEAVFETTSELHKKLVVYRKNMSSLKTSDPKKRDFIVEEFLKRKKNIEDSYLSERLGDIDIHREMSKLFKPITEAQQDVKESLLGELRPIKNSCQQ